MLNNQASLAFTQKTLQSVISSIAFILKDYIGQCIFLSAKKYDETTYSFNSFHPWITPFICADKKSLHYH
jgi:hypothetical protein